MASSPCSQPPPTIESFMCQSPLMLCRVFFCQCGHALHMSGEDMPFIITGHKTLMHSSPGEAALPMLRNMTCSTQPLSCLVSHQLAAISCG